MLSTALQPQLIVERSPGQASTSHKPTQSLPYINSHYVLPTRSLLQRLSSISAPASAGPCGGQVKCRPDRFSPGWPLTGQSTNPPCSLLACHFVGEQWVRIYICLLWDRTSIYTKSSCKMICSHRGDSLCSADEPDLIAALTDAGIFIISHNVGFPEHSVCGAQELPEETDLSQNCVLGCHPIENPAAKGPT